MEYMSTGTPLLSTNLPGIPEDHYPYIYTIKKETSEGFYEALNEILNKNRSEIHSFGLKSKKFVLSEKNNVKQAKKIIHLLLN